MKSRSRVLADKSLDAMLSALEVYNKPDFSYREETFSILAVNGWELLLKARILQLANNKVSSILKYESRKKVDGTRNEKEYRVKNKLGTCLSIGLFRAIERLEIEYGDKLDSPSCIKGVRSCINVFWPLTYSGLNGALKRFVSKI